MMRETKESMVTFYPLIDLQVAEALAPGRDFRRGGVCPVRY
jgi:hypothetical protein